MVLDGGIRPHRQAGLQPEDGPQRTRGYPGMQSTAATGSSLDTTAAWTSISSKLFRCPHHLQLRP